MNMKNVPRHTGARLNDRPQLLIRVELEQSPVVMLVADSEADELRLRRFLENARPQVDDLISQWLEEAA